MEQNNEKFDKDIKKALDDHEVPVPEQVWEKIIARKEEKKGAVYFKRYRWMLFLLLLIPIYAGYELFLQQEGNTDENAQLSEEPPGESLNQSTNGKAIEKINNPGNNSESSREANDKVSNDDSIKASDQANEPSPSKNSPSPKSRDKGNAISVVLASNQDNDELNEDSNESQITGNSSNEQTKGESTEDSNSKEVNDKIALQNINQPADDTTGNKQSENDEINLITDSTTTLKTDSVAEEKKQEKEEEKPSEKEKFIPKYSMEFVGSPDVSFKHLQDNPDNTAGNYKKRREDSEQHDYAYSFNLFFRYDFSKKFFVRSGIQYARVYENLSLQYKERYIAGFLIDTLLKGYIIDPFQPPIPYFLVDTIYDYRYNEYQFAADNRYTYVNIPVIAGANFNFKKFDVYATAGITFNISASAKGNIIAPDSIYLLVIEDQAKTPFKTKTGLSFMTSVGVSYHLSDKIHFLFEPNFRTNLSSITKNEYPLRQKYSAVGFGIGMKYDF